MKLGLMKFSFMKFNFMKLSLKPGGEKKPSRSKRADKHPSHHEHYSFAQKPRPYHGLTFIFADLGN